MNTCSLRFVMVDDRKTCSLGAWDKVEDMRTSSLRWDKLEDKRTRSLRRELVEDLRT